MKITGYGYHSVWPNGTASNHRTKPRQITERNRVKSPNAIDLHPREAHVEGYCFGSRSVFRMALLRFRSNASVRPKTLSIASLEFVI